MTIHRVQSLEPSPCTLPANAFLPPPQPNISFPFTGYQSDYVRLNGTLPITYRPTFTFHVVRYMEITMELPEGRDLPDLAWFRGYPVNVDMPRTNETAAYSGPSFEVQGQPLFNAIDQLSYGSFLSNWAQGIQSDCPGRERLGYGGDMMTSAEAAMYLFDAHMFYRKRVQDYADARRPNGGLPETSPFIGIETCDLGEGAGPMQWGSGMLFTAYQLYVHYNDTDTFVTYRAVARQWLDLLRSSAEPSRASVLGNGSYILHNGLPGFNEAGDCTGVLATVMGTAFFHQQVGRSVQRDTLSRRGLADDGET